MPDLIQNQQQLDQVLNNLDGVDLFVFTLGGAHLSDTQQQCPNFCIEAAELGQKVVIVNIDLRFIHATERLISEDTHENLICHYGTLRYINSESENFYHEPLNKLISTNYLKIIHEQLIKNQQLKIVYLYQISNMIPEFYLANANPEEANRVRFLASTYNNSPGHIYSPVQLSSAAKSKSVERYNNKFKIAKLYTNGDSGCTGRTFAEYLDDKEKQQEWLQSFEAADLGLDGYSFICLKTLRWETLFSPDVFGSENQQQRNKWRAQEVNRFEEFVMSEQEHTLEQVNTPGSNANTSTIAQAMQGLILKSLNSEYISGFTDDAHDFDDLIEENWPKIRQIAIRNNLFLPTHSDRVTQKYQLELWEKIKEYFTELEIKSAKNEAILELLKERFVDGDLSRAYDAYKDERLFGDKPVAINALEYWLVTLDFISHKDENFQVNKPEQIIESIYDQDDMAVSYGGFIAKVFAETAMAAYYQKHFSASPSVTEDAPNDTTRADVQVVERIIKRLERNSRSCCSPGSAKKASDLRVALNNAVVMGIEDVRTDEEIKRIVSRHRSISFFRKTKSLQELENSFVEVNIRP